MDKCSICGATTRRRKVDLPTRVNNKFLVVKGVPAYVCVQCDEIYYDLKTARALEDVENRVERGRVQLQPIRNAYEVELAGA
ncbi:MAG: type II toxin-antitoxin system MqsA family antitoxin [Euryarchaeota archaeon]|nr:type II toxin-antitoxin system MqsA family antitoxin [Euryarchaeota archaeon]